MVGYSTSHMRRTTKGTPIIYHLTDLVLRKKYLVQDAGTYTQRYSRHYICYDHIPYYLTKQYKLKKRNHFLTTAT